MTVLRRSRRPRQPRNTPEDVLAEVQAWHREVDTQAAEVAGRLGDRLRCARGCAACCRDDITVFTVEAALIRRHCGDLIVDAQAHPEGQCAFLSSAGACRIYSFRPYVCRTQGLPLRFFDHGPHGQPVEFRDICPLNEPGEPRLDLLPEESCWTIGPAEGRLAELQRAFDGRLHRVALRDLFL